MSLHAREGRRAERDRLLDFAEGALTGRSAPFAYLDADGAPIRSQGYQLWITARMIHVFALEHLAGRAGASSYVRAGVSALVGAFHDPDHDGWFAHLGFDGGVLDDRKSMYDHAFIALAASSAVAAGVDDAKRLLHDVLAVIDDHFWDDQAGACRESWDRAWTSTENYRGGNSNMHAVEAFLAVAQVTGDPTWTRRALRICERVVHGAAADNRWRLPEHFDDRWGVQAGYNDDRPRDRFRPFGVTIGHLFEWSRLLAHVDLALPDPPAWLLADALALFETAMAVGWEADGKPGLVYTVDWSDNPVVTERMHWVSVEAAMAADVLARRTGDQAIAAWLPALWADVERFVDHDRGSWNHELDERGLPSATVWSGKPDAYHAVQGMLLPDLPLTASFVGSVGRS